MPRPKPLPTECLVDGCQKTARKRGYCIAHHAKLLRHGNVNGGYGAVSAFLRRAAQFQDDECLLWPYGQTTTGYGAINRDRYRGTGYAHRVVCEIAHGAPFDGAEAAHSCQRPLCVNPMHLRWATPKENQADKLIHGTLLYGEHHPAAKLAAVDARFIRTSVSSEQELASKFNVAPTTIRSIRNGRNWKREPQLGDTP